MLKTFSELAASSVHDFRACPPFIRTEDNPDKQVSSVQPLPWQCLLQF